MDRMISFEFIEKDELLRAAIYDDCESMVRKKFVEQIKTIA